MKSIPKVLLTLSLILFSSNFVLADNAAEEVDSQTPVVTEDTKNKTTTSVNKYFELELLFDSQSPLNKSIQYTLLVTPKIDSPRTQITWDLPSVLKANPKHNEFVSLNKDQQYTFRVVINPNRQGIYDVTANVTSWQNEVNFTNSVSTTVTLDNGLVVQPVDSSYTVSLILFILATLGVFGAIIFFAYKLSPKAIEKLRKWLTPPY